VETDNWPFVQARWFTPFTAGRRRVRVIVIHDMEFTERSDAAEVIAHDFATRPATSKASAHICVDNNSIVQCVKDNDIAYAAPGANRDGIQIELAGYGRQSREQWLDQYGVALLALAADATAQYCLKYDITPVQLTNKELADGAKGIVGHFQVSAVYKQSDHTDPGSYFPWDYFLKLVLSFYNVRRVRAA
jgi:N-acetyl-anhydromuramyl-L-alanine amidase AmpD